MFAVRQSKTVGAVNIALDVLCWCMFVLINILLLLPNLGGASKHWLCSVQPLGVSESAPCKH